MPSAVKRQSRVERLEDLESAWKYAASAGRVQGARVIIESLIEFDYEITLLTVRALGEDGKIETQFCDPIGHVQVKGDYVESWQPQPMSDKVLARAKEIAEAVTGALGGRGLFGVGPFGKGPEGGVAGGRPR